MTKDVNCTCPGCGQHLSIPGEMAEQMIQCPTCQKHFPIAPVESAQSTRPCQPVRKPTGLTPANLTLSKETIYLTLIVIISVVLWLLAIVTIFPVLVALFIAVAIWFANGLLVARLKAEAVKVSSSQLPSLANTLHDVCRLLSVAPVPDLYVVQSGGMLNAFTSKHAGRNFVVVYSELLETYGPNSPEIRFLLGHEIGHIHRRHILKQILLAPGLLMPLLGSAYSRACEASCDRHGAFAAGDVDGSVHAMMVLAGGKQAKLMDPDSFAQQYRELRGFFVSWHELISGYPTLSQRVSNLLALVDGRVPFKAARHPLAYIFAFFSFGGRGGGGANLLITVAVIGLLASIAIPSFVKARAQSQKNARQNDLRRAAAAGAQGDTGSDAGVAADVIEHSTTKPVILPPAFTPIDETTSDDAPVKLDVWGLPADDNEQAMKWYLREANKGNIVAINNLGWKYIYGRGVGKDVAAGAKWFRKAADRGDAVGQNNLGDCYYNGLGVTQDYAEAVKWYRKARAQGLANASHSLGVCYELGNGVEKSSAEAVPCYRGAAEDGCASAQYDLGRCYLYGVGTTKDVQTAYGWYLLASEGGSKEAAKALKRVDQQLSSDEQRAARTWAKNWKPGQFNCFGDPVVK